MPVAVLSPCVLDPRGKEEFVHYSLLATLLQNLYINTNLELQRYRKAPYEGYKMDIPVYEQSHTLNNLVAINIYGVIQKMLSKEYIDLDGVQPATLPEEFHIGQDPISLAFRSYLNYLGGKSSVLFIGEDNFAVQKPIRISADQQFVMNTSTYIKIELSTVLLPYLKAVTNPDAIFPRESFCSGYNNYVLKQIKEKSMEQAEKNALFEKVGTTVATYNMYTKNTHLSSLNSSRAKKRIVFEKSVGKKFFVSLDLESGGFEVFDRRLHHLGQYSFSCEKVKSSEPETHILLR